MSDADRPEEFGLLAEAGVPQDRDREHLDARELPPPKPLSETLERLVELPDDTVLVQENDRVPQHLFPKLEDRGYVWESMETADGTVLTAIWKPA
jgi:hypothetical protein